MQAWPPSDCKLDERELNLNTMSHRINILKFYIQNTQIHPVFFLFVHRGKCYQLIFSFEGQISLHLFTGALCLDIVSPHHVRPIGALKKWKSTNYRHPDQTQLDWSSTAAGGKQANLWLGQAAQLGWTSTARGGKQAKPVVGIGGAVRQLANSIGPIVLSPDYRIYYDIQNLDQISFLKINICLLLIPIVI